VPAALLAWTWLGSTLANLAFFGRPALAGYGCLALGVTVAPYLLLLGRDLLGVRSVRSVRPGGRDGDTAGARGQMDDAARGAR
jgi:putative membrane protein